MSKTILITGATGNQGGATLHNLLGKGFALRALTRKPESEKARALANNGVEVVQGDLNDVESLKKALAGAWGVLRGPEHLGSGRHGRGRAGEAHR